MAKSAEQLEQDQVDTNRWVDPRMNGGFGGEVTLHALGRAAYEQLARAKHAQGWTCLVEPFAVTSPAKLVAFELFQQLVKSEHARVAGLEARIAELEHEALARSSETKLMMRIAELEAQLVEATEERRRLLAENGALRAEFAALDALIVDLRAELDMQDHSTPTITE